MKTCLKKKKLGIWIDHQEAVLVLLEGHQATIERINSDVETHYHPSGGWKASGTHIAQAISNEHTLKERREHHLHSFYQTIIKTFNNIENIFIFGPGEAKFELTKEIEKLKDQHAEIAAVETCDKLTENQIVAQVKSFFKRSHH